MKSDAEVYAKKILVLAPHTDDGELGCGGTIAKFCTEGREVHYAAFSTCKRSLPQGFLPDTLEKECREAVAKLGMDKGKLMFYDFEVRDFIQKRQEILEELVSLNKYIQPELVLIPSSTDIHQDHQVVHQEAQRAFRHSSLIGYEMPWNQSSFNAQLFIKLTEKHLAKKIDSLSSYKSQSHRIYMQEKFMRSLATVRGAQVNAEFAEAFEVYRLIH